MKTFFRSITVLAFVALLALPAFGQDLPPKRKKAEAPAAAAPVAPAGEAPAPAEAEKGKADSLAALNQRVSILEESLLKLNKDFPERIATLARSLSEIRTKINRLSYAVYLMGVVALTIFIIRIRRPRRPTSLGSIKSAMVLMIGLGSLLTVQPTWAAGPAARIVSISPDYVGQGRDGSSDEKPPLDVVVACQPSCPKNVKAIEFSKTGLSVVDKSLAVKAGRVSFKLAVADNADLGFSQFDLVLEDGVKIESPDGVYLQVFSRDSANVVSRLEKRTGTIPVAMRHDLQARFQAVYGQDDGQKRYRAYVRRPSHGVIAELIGREREAANGGLRQELRAEAEARKGLETRVAAAERQAGEVAVKAEQYEPVIQELQKRQADVEGWQKVQADATFGLQKAVEETGVEVTNLAETRVSAGGFRSVFGRKRQLDPSVRGRLEQVFRESRKSTERLRPLVTGRVTTQSK